MKNKKLIGFVSGLLLSVATVVQAYTFEDNFDDQGINQNWLPFSGIWDYVPKPGTENYAYHGASIEDEDAISFADHGMHFLNEGLTINSTFKFYFGTAPSDERSGVDVGFSINTNVEELDGYSVGIFSEDRNQDGVMEYYLSVTEINDRGTEVEQVLSGAINEGTFINLWISVGTDNKFQAAVHDMDNNFLGGIVDYQMDLPFQSGQVALHAAYSQAYFTNFSLNATPLLNDDWTFCIRSEERSFCDGSVVQENIEVAVPIVQLGHDIAITFPDDPADQVVTGRTSNNSLAGWDNDVNQSTLLSASISEDYRQINGRILFADKHSCPNAETGNAKFTAYRGNADLTICDEYFNVDCDVDGIDLAIFSQQYGQTCQ